MLWACMFYGYTAGAENGFDTSRLNPCLNKLYRSLAKGEKLVGKTVTCALELKFADKNRILFQDGYIRIDAKTKYSFLKFSKGMKLPGDIGAYKKVHVSFKIIATSRTMATAGWPTLGVQLVSMRSR